MKTLMLFVVAALWGLLCLTFDIPIWLTLFVGLLIGWHWESIYQLLFARR